MNAIVLALLSAIRYQRNHNRILALLILEMSLNVGTASPRSNSSPYDAMPRQILKRILTVAKQWVQCHNHSCDCLCNPTLARTGAIL
jgi:hypothetical protein